MLIFLLFLTIPSFRRMKKFRYLNIALIVLVLAACGPSDKERLMNEMTVLVEQLGLHYADMTDEEWTSIDQRVEGYINKYDELKLEMTDEEKQRINELVGQYAAIRTKRFGLEVEEWLEDFSGQLDGFLREIENTATKDIEEIFE